MPNAEADLLEIRKYFARWIAEVKLAVDGTYFDINKVSEGTCLHLLNLVFNYQLEDLNRKKINFPGIDLGDTRKSMLAFQITSRTDTGKIRNSLQTFLRQNYLDIFPNGIRFFIINNSKTYRSTPGDSAIYRQFFDAKQHILFPETLIKAIEQIYYSDKTRFDKIKAFLRRQFGDEQKRSVFTFDNAAEKVSYFRKMFAAENRNASPEIVPFDCKFKNEKISTEELPVDLFAGNGVLITGPSGCGKSVLARHLGRAYLDVGLPIVLEAKYYDDGLSDWLNKRITAFGLDDGASFFELARAEQLPILFIVDGLNEWGASERSRLLVELEKLKNDFQINVLITTQDNQQLETLQLSSIEVDLPTFETKNAIAALYSGNNDTSKLEPILKIVSTGMEAKMVGEIGVEPVEKISRFELFQLFFGRKLEGLKYEGFILLSKIAEQLSEKLTLSLSEQVVIQMIRSEGIPNEVYDRCISTKLLDRVLGKVSFGHEMFYNFFFAVGITKSSHRPADIVSAIKLPRNQDIKLLIVGSIADDDVLKVVLSSITDDDLLLSLYLGEGGEFCRIWVERQVKDTISKIERELAGLEYIATEDSGWGIKIRNESLFKWSTYQWALIATIPSLLVKEHFIDEFFQLVSILEDRRFLAVRDLIAETSNKKRNFGSATFASVYVGFSQDQPAITRIFSNLASGFVTFRNASEVKPETVAKLLSKDSLDYGQFYFLLVLIRYNDTLHVLYPYVVRILTDHWRKAPYHLKNEILMQIRHFPRDDQQRLHLAALLTTILTEEQNSWSSTMIFDALESLDALEADAEEHIEVVKWQIQRLLTQDENATSSQEAAGIYNAQFDHPYSIAYIRAIDDLSDDDKKRFYHLTIQGAETSLFTRALILEAYRHLKAEIAPYLTKWTNVPVFEQVFSQEALSAFFLSTVIVGKCNSQFASKYKEAKVGKDQCLQATAEVLYWLNRTNLTPGEQRQNCKYALNHLFDLENRFSIECLWQSRSVLTNLDPNKYFFEHSPISFIDEVFPNQVLHSCRHCLSNLELQQEVLPMTRQNEIIGHAIAMLEALGTILDNDVLRSLVDHPSYGTSALRAIRNLNKNAEQKG